MKFIIVSGSNRKEATSTKVGKYMTTYIQQKRSHAQLFDLYRLPLPLYSPDEDTEQDQNITLFKKQLTEADGIVLITPEYHGSISGVLKNALDHVSAHQFHDKPVLSVSVAGGAVGISSLQQLQVIVRNLHGLNSPEWLSIGGSQRESFESTDFSYSTGEGSAIIDRIHHVTDYFISMTKQLRKEND
ncbi:NAD(P)H-dependent oxidoreductase [Paenibacillus sp. Marseille-Q4541]|uniref:NADPH-dependent FMN reductase n=1 Tax=Paenibacillus sp. Marseille-Q4541 TaxID=2831522 RepID=UPI001BA76180|nr:NAD(P)H-dependent oxidoreductase [Paenibacillus sp. Marseille-Q4541]